MRTKLLSFKLSGIKSLQNEIELKFSNYLLKDPSKNIAKVKSIYGVNGAGKTSVVLGMKILTEFLRSPEYLSENRVILNDLINYNKEYITDFFEIRVADVVYKFKNNNVFFLIEHQRKVDYSMPYRIFEYKSEILKSNVDREGIKQKSYKVPLIIAVVIYTGSGNWKVPQNLLQVQEQCTTYLKEQLGINSFYVLEDVNKYSNQELLESNNFLEKIFLLEKSKNEEEVKENFIKIIDKLQEEEKQGKITKEAKEEFENNIIKILLPKISEEEIKEQLQKVEKTNKKGDGKMYGLAVCDMLARENRKIEKRGLRNGIIQVATNMLKAKMDHSTIKSMTGLTDEELEELNTKI